jgi:hypothetical protein
MLTPLFAAIALIVGQTGPDPSKGGVPANWPGQPVTSTDLPQTPASSDLSGVLPVADYQSSGPGAPPPSPDSTAASSGQSATQPAAPKPYRRGLPPPMDSPPFPGAEWQGYPLVGVAPDTTHWPLQRFMQGTYLEDFLDTERIRVYGWINASGNISSSHNSNSPDSYWLYANQVEMDQTVVRIERQLDSVQTDHWDWGFRSTYLYGIDYRYMTSGGWFSDQLLLHNRLYGFDPTEQYFEVYTPEIAQGLILRVGRWIACPDIETQFAPDNYMGSHSILFTFDTYTQTGIMATVMLNDQWTVQGCIFAGTDMAPWYKGAIPTGMFGIRWVSKSNNDSIYTVLNAINSARFRTFEEDGQPAGHDNFNYIVTTWQHRFTPGIITKTEAYYMWQYDAYTGGTPSLGPVMPYGSGGGLGTFIPGCSRTYGTVNYTMFELSKKDFITFRNEYWRDEEGERSGFPSTYTSNGIGLTHNFTPELQIRPEIDYFRSWCAPAFNNGTRFNQVMFGVDVTLRF